MVIIEVLSKSTAAYDRSDKFYMYRQLPSLQEYVLIEQHKMQIEIYKREKADLWQITRVSSQDKELHLQSLDLKIPLSAIYEDVVFEQE